MALTFGQLLAGAGRVASGMREEQEAQRRAQLNEMRLQEARRLEAERQAQQQAQLAYQIPQQAPVPEFRPGLSLAQMQRPAAPAQQMPSRTNAAEMVRMQAAQQQAQPALGEQPLTNIPPAAMESLRRMAEARGMSMAEIPLDAGFDTAYDYIVQTTGTRLGDIADVAGPAAGYIAENIPAVQRRRERLQEGGASGLIAQGLIDFADPLRSRYILPAVGGVLGTIGRAGLGLATDVGRQIISPGARPKEQPEEMPEVRDGEVQTPDFTEELDAPVTGRVTQAGVSQETQQILDSGDFYLANPQSITRDMQTVMGQRQNLARMAEMYRRAGLGDQYLQTALKIQEMDNNLLYLQGIEGIEELRTYNDPRRVSAVLRQVTGRNIDYQPRPDGRYNEVTFDAQGRMQVLREGLTADAIANEARLRIDPAARQNLAEISAERQRRALDLEFFQREENIKTLNDMAKALQQGQIDRANTLAGRVSGALTETSEGIFLRAVTPSGNIAVYRYDPATEGESNWISADVPAADAAFTNIPGVGAAGLITRPDIRVAEQLQTWND